MDEIIQALIALLVIGLPAIAQLLGRKKKDKATPTPQPVRRQAAPRAGEDIAARVKRMLAEASGQEQQPVKPPVKPPPTPVKPKPPKPISPVGSRFETFDNSSFAPQSATMTVPLGDGGSDSLMEGSVFGASKGKAMEKPTPPISVIRHFKSDSQTRALFRNNPELAIIGLEVLGPPRALREFGE